MDYTDKMDFFISIVAGLIISAIVLGLDAIISYLFDVPFCITVSASLALYVTLSIFFPPVTIGTIERKKK